MHFCIRLCHLWKHSAKSFSVRPFSSLVTVALISSIETKCVHLSTVFSLGKSQKSQGARSREYGAVICFLANNCLALSAVWAGALSWWSIHDLFLHRARLVRRTRSCRWLRTYWLTVWPSGTNSWWTNPFWSKNAISMTFIFDLDMRAFLGLGEFAVFHCRLCLSVSGSYWKTQVTSHVLHKPPWEIWDTQLSAFPA